MNNKAAVLAPLPGIGKEYAAAVADGNERGEQAMILLAILGGIFAADLASECPAAVVMEG